MDAQTLRKGGFTLPTNTQAQRSSSIHHGNLDRIDLTALKHLKTENDRPVQNFAAYPDYLRGIDVAVVASSLDL